jgi:hypothetical protein
MFIGQARPPPPAAQEYYKDEFDCGAPLLLAVSNLLQLAADLDVLRFLRVGSGAAVLPFNCNEHMDVGSNKQLDVTALRPLLLSASRRTKTQIVSTTAAAVANKPFLQPVLVAAIHYRDRILKGPTRMQKYHQPNKHAPPSSCR